MTLEIPHFETAKSLMYQHEVNNPAVIFFSIFLKEVDNELSLSPGSTLIL